MLTHFKNVKDLRREDSWSLNGIILWLHTPEDLYQTCDHTPAIYRNDSKVAILQTWNVTWYLCHQRWLLRYWDKWLFDLKESKYNMKTSIQKPQWNKSNLMSMLRIQEKRGQTEFKAKLDGRVPTKTSAPLTTAAALCSGERKRECGFQIGREWSDAIS